MEIVPLQTKRIYLFFSTFFDWIANSVLLFPNQVTSLFSFVGSRASRTSFSMNYVHTKIQASTPAIQAKEFFVSHKSPKQRLDEPSSEQPNSGNEENSSIPTENRKKKITGQKDFSDKSCKNTSFRRQAFGFLLRKRYGLKHRGFSEPVAKQCKRSMLKEAIKVTNSETTQTKLT